MRTRCKLLESDRLLLIASTATHIRAELEAPEQLTHLLGASVSSAWPSGEYDRHAMEFFLSRLEEGGESAEGWYGWYALGSDSPGSPGSPRTLIGAGGYFGPPDAEGTVEVGYSVLPEWQHRGYASDMVRVLVAHAFTFGNINRVIAHTAAENTASVRVLARCGFQAVGAGADPGTVRFEVHRRA